MHAVLKYIYCFVLGAYYMLFSLSIPSKRLQHVAHYWKWLGRGSGWRSHLSSKAEGLNLPDNHIE